MTQWNGNRIKEWINANFDLEKDRTILLICIGLAFFFWLLVKLSKDYKSEVVAVATYALPDDLTFTKIPPEKIRVSVIGSGWNLVYQHFISGAPKLAFDLSDRQIFDINRTELEQELSQHISQDLTILSLSHDELELNLETKVVRKVPLDFSPKVSFATGFYLLDSIRLYPDSVTVAGPASLVDSVTHWHTESFEVKNLKSSLTTDLALIPSRKAEIKIDPPTVELQIPVEQLTEKSFFVPVTVQNAPFDSLQIFPNKIRINTIMGLSHYNKVKPSEFEIVADLRNITQNTEENSIPITLTKQSELSRSVHFSPKSVEFVIIEKTMAEDLKTEGQRKE